MYDQLSLLMKTNIAKISLSLVYYDYELSLVYYDSELSLVYFGSEFPMAISQYFPQEGLH